jgi:hypothetical protein
VIGGIGGIGRRLLIFLKMIFNKEGLKIKTRLGFLHSDISSTLSGTKLREIKN